MDMGFRLRTDEAFELKATVPASEPDIRLSPWLIAEILADLEQERVRRVILASGGLRTC